MNTGCGQIRFGWFNHGILGNASLCGTEMAEKKGFLSFQPQVAHVQRGLMFFAYAIGFEFVV